MITEFVPGVEYVTAVLTSHLATGENFDGAITIGHYGNATEIWIELQGTRQNITIGDVDGLCKQLRRAKKKAIETEGDWLCPSTEK